MILRADLINEIARLRQELKANEDLLETFDRHFLNDKRSGREVRFYGVPPRIAIAQVLQEAGHAMTQETITEILVAGGATIGKKRDQKQPNNIRIGFEKLLQNGKLKKVGDLVGKAEWTSEKFERGK